MLGIMKNVTSNMLPRSRGAVSLWQLVVKSRVLYGAGVIHCTKEWKEEGERVQNLAGRWILETSISTTAVAVRRFPIKEEVVIRKVSWLVKARNMGEGRLPRLVLGEMEKVGERSKWLKVVSKYVEEYKLEGGNEGREECGELGGEGVEKEDFE